MVIEYLRKLKTSKNKFWQVWVLSGLWFISLCCTDLRSYMYFVFCKGYTVQPHPIQCSGTSDIQGIVFRVPNEDILKVRPEKHQLRLSLVTLQILFAPKQHMTMLSSPPTMFLLFHYNAYMWSKGPDICLQCKFSTTTWCELFTSDYTAPLLPLTSTPTEAGEDSLLLS